MSTWHATPDALADFATRPEQLDDTVAASLELHLLACDECRAAVAGAADTRALGDSWDAVADRIDQPAPSPVERLLRRLGVSDNYARLVGATRALQVAWLAALAVVVVATVVGSRGTDTNGAFLVFAPLIPVGAVAIAFAAGAEPAGETALVAPIAGAGLVMRRAVAVVSASFVLLVAGSLALPHLALADAAWVLPALGLSLGALALATWVRVETAAVALGIGWLGALWGAALEVRGHESVTELAPLAPAGQVACAALAVAAVAVLVVRRPTFATIGRRP
ncbi:MAG TPA: hypothetical protein VFB78_06540 [Acidimicrobiales bacterium]|nr:hypothetical protein [Acidimicrobiales bacterium]